MLLELVVVEEEEAVVVEAAVEAAAELLPPPRRALALALVREHVLVEEQAAVSKSTGVQAAVAATTFKHQSPKHPRKNNTNQRRHFRFGFGFGLSRPRSSSTSDRGGTHSTAEATRGCGTDPCRGWRLPRSNLASFFFFVGLLLRESMSLAPGELLSASSSGAGARTWRWLSLSLLRLCSKLLKWIL